jgi:hypothetical protein
MATPAQIQANRLNSMKSSGPRSNEGKAASRFNALKHGIDAKSLTIPGEDPAELETLALDYHRQLRPVGPLENFFVETIVKSDWDRRRYARIEARVYRLQLAAVAPGPEGAPLPAVGLDLGEVFLNDALKANALQKLFRRQQAAERSYYRALTELRRAQRERMEEAAHSDGPADDPAAAVSLESTPIGFVPRDSFLRGADALSAAPGGAMGALPGACPATPARTIDLQRGYTEK